MNSGSRGLCLRSRLAAGWTSGFSRSASKPPANAHPPSFQKSLTSSLNRGTPPTRLISVLLLPLPSPPLMALKRRDTCTCPLWMSPWPRISARSWLSDGRGGRTIRPSKPCRATSALAGCTYSAVSSNSLFGASCGGLCGVVYGGSDVVTSMRHFLPKCASSSAASSRPKPGPTQQPAKPIPATPNPRPPKDRQDRGRSCSARRYPFPKRQRPRPKIALDQAPQKSSCSGQN